MKKFFGYIRVSTPRQGKGVSLQEQRDAIMRYAGRDGIEVVRWFEERETAAKRGRPIFNEMLRLLRLGKADGVLIHNIDRSVRNLGDWTELVDRLPEQIEIQFVSEGLDLRSTTGRLAADLKAAVSAHYVRNLKEEIRKGFYGRLKQGVYPLPAPLGYLDLGAGKPKEIDPVKGPLVRHAFELYSEGKHTLEALAEELHQLGLRNRRNSAVTFKGLAQTLRNPFYIGLIRLRRTGETFPGAHEPLVETTLFERVQARLDGRANRWEERHAFQFRRFWKCRHCHRSLVPSLHKGHVYYRCQTASCPTICYREETLRAIVTSTLQPCEFDEEERAEIERRMEELTATWRQEGLSRSEGLRLRFGQVENRLERLTDALIDGTLDKESFERRKATLLLERQGLREALADMAAHPETVGQRVREFLELAGSLYSQYELVFDEKKRRLLEDVTSNRVVDEKNVELTLLPPFRTVAERTKSPNCGASRMRSRTLERLLNQVIDWFREHPSAAFGIKYRGSRRDEKEEDLAA
jgi:site-specific DNA recombinase